MLVHGFKKEHFRKDRGKTIIEIVVPILVKWKGHPFLLLSFI